MISVIDTEENIMGKGEKGTFFFSYEVFYRFFFITVVKAWDCVTMTPFDAPGKQAFWKHNFSFTHSVFYPFRELSAIFIKFKIVVCKLFQFGPV